MYTLYGVWQSENKKINKIAKLIILCGDVCVGIVHGTKWAEARIRYSYVAQIKCKKHDTTKIKEPLNIEHKGITTTKRCLSMTNKWNTTND